VIRPSSLLVAHHYNSHLAQNFGRKRGIAEIDGQRSTARGYAGNPKRTLYDFVPDSPVSLNLGAAPERPELPTAGGLRPRRGS
jgi:hypothetical protein